MTEKTGVARLRAAINNQASAGEACFSLTMGEARALCAEIDDELLEICGSAEREIGRYTWVHGVPAPVDADGEKVPLTTKVMYDDDGNAREGNVFKSFIWSRESDQWYFCVYPGSREVASLHLRRPDSWERLEKDVKRYGDERTACMYYERPMSECDGCPARDAEDCDGFVAADVLRRAKALAGRSED